LRRKTGEQLGLAETWMSMAELLLATNQPSEAEQLLRNALEEFKKENSRDDEIAATGLLARALLEQGKSAEAGKTIEQAKTMVARVDNPYVQSNFFVEAARVQAFSGKSTEAVATLESVIQTAGKFGFLNTQLKARLALAILSRKGLASTSSSKLLNWLEFPVLPSHSLRYDLC